MSKYNLDLRNRFINKMQIKINKLNKSLLLLANIDKKIYIEHILNKQMRGGTGENGEMIKQIHQELSKRLSDAQKNYDQHLEELDNKNKEYIQYIKIIRMQETGDKKLVDNEIGDINRDYHRNIQKIELKQKHLIENINNYFSEKIKLLNISNSDILLETRKELDEERRILELKQEYESNKQEQEHKHEKTNESLQKQMNMEKDEGKQNALYEKQINDSIQIHNTLQQMELEHLQRLEVIKLENARKTSNIDDPEKIIEVLKEKHKIEEAILNKKLKDFSELTKFVETRSKLAITDTDKRTQINTKKRQLENDEADLQKKADDELKQIMDALNPDDLKILKSVQTQKQQEQPAPPEIIDLTGVENLFINLNNFNVLTKFHYATTKKLSTLLHEYNKLMNKYHNNFHDLGIANIYAEVNDIFINNSNKQKFKKLLQQMTVLDASNIIDLSNFKLEYNDFLQFIKKDNEFDKYDEYCLKSLLKAKFLLFNEIQFDKIYEFEKIITGKLKEPLKMETKKYINLLYFCIGFTDNMHSSQDTNGVKVPSINIEEWDDNDSNYILILKRLQIKKNDMNMIKKYVTKHSPDTWKIIKANLDINKDNINNILLVNLNHNLNNIIPNL